MSHHARRRRSSLYSKPLRDGDGDAAGVWMPDELCAVCGASVGPGSLFCSAQCRLRDQGHHAIPHPQPAEHDRPSHDQATVATTATADAMALPPGTTFNALPSPAQQATAARPGQMTPHLHPRTPMQPMQPAAARASAPRSPGRLSTASISPSVSEAESDRPPSTPSPRLTALSGAAAEARPAIKSPTMRFVRKPNATNMPAPVLLASPALAATTRRPTSSSNTPTSPWTAGDHPSRSSSRPQSRTLHSHHASHPHAILEDDVDSDAASCISGFDLGPSARDHIGLHLTPATSTAAPPPPPSTCTHAARPSSPLAHRRLPSDSIVALRNSLHMAAIERPRGAHTQTDTVAELGRGRNTQPRALGHAVRQQWEPEEERGRSRTTDAARGRAGARRTASSIDMDSCVGSRSRSSVAGQELETRRDRSSARAPRSISRRRSPSPPRRGDRRLASRVREQLMLEPAVDLSAPAPALVPDARPDPIPELNPTNDKLSAGLRASALALAVQSAVAPQSRSPTRRRSPCDSRKRSSGGSTAPLVPVPPSSSLSPCSPSSSLLSRGRAVTMHLGMRGARVPVPVSLKPRGL